MKPAAREGDAHVCDKHGGDKIAEGSSNVNINGKPAARVDDHIICKTGEKTQIKSGSSSVSINGKPAARVDDPTGHDGKITSGSDNVSIGKSGKPTTIGSKGPVSIGGNGKPVTIGQAAEEVLDIANLALGVSEILGGIPLDEAGVGEVMQGDGARRIAATALRNKIRGTRTKNRLPEGKGKDDLGPPSKRLEKRNPQTKELQQTRDYDENGKPKKNIDYGHDHNGTGDPHAHDWTYESDQAPNPTRGPARPLQPGEK